jgi:hypothetical protein
MYRHRSGEKPQSATACVEEGKGGEEEGGAYGEKMELGTATRRDERHRAGRDVKHRAPRS